MTAKEFWPKFRKVIIIILLLLVAYLVYRYFWQQRSIASDIYTSKSKIYQELGIDGTVVQPVLQEQGGTKPDQICLTPETQQKIADEINKKLQEINACDCRDACRTAQAGNNVTTSSPSSSSKKLGNNVVEIFGNYDFY